ncbi:hypothetical protein [Plantactinospora sp. GCM10030261]|uniref:hypothetical protein n=1 Tax=Plantactinospora sp. GCM10030261 TaxID=3273420 RepID=UPI003624216E
MDWETRAAFLDAWVRALTRPYPGAFTWLGEHKLVVWRGRALRPGPDSVDAGGHLRAGTVLSHRPDGVPVACGDGALLVVEAALAGGSPVSGDGLRDLLPAGTVLG